MADLMKVIVAIDKSDYAEYAFQYYMKYIHKPEYEVVLLHVVEIPASSIMYMSGTMWEEQVQREKDKTNMLEKEYKERIEREQFNGKISTVYGNKPGEMICTTAEDMASNMIVMGSRGSGKVRRTIMGSVSDYVLHHAHCPVVVCRQEGRPHHQSILQRLRSISGDRPRRHSESDRERKNSERERKLSERERKNSEREHRNSESEDRTRKISTSSIERKKKDSESDKSKQDSTGSVEK